MLKDSGKKQLMSRQRNRWKIGSVVIIAVFVSGVLLFGWLFHVGSTDEITSVANQFKADPTWQLEDEHIEPPATICFDVACPSVSRTWKTPQLVTEEELSHVLRQSEWPFEISGECKSTNISSGTRLPICTATGDREGYIIKVSVTSSEQSNGVNLSIERR